MTLRCGLLGETLGHSYSPRIHAYLGDYDYRLYEVPKDKVEDFILHGDWDGLNVTIPYKKVAASLCDELSDIARSLGSVNTIVKRDGKLYGYNTDYHGFRSMVLETGIDISGKKALVLGTGGTGVTVRKVLSEMGAEVIPISRNGENNYDNIEKHSDAALVVNATPVGMYPKNGASPLDLRKIPACECVLDVIYNPMRTALILQAESLGLKYKSGLHMLIAQAKYSSEHFQNTKISDDSVTVIESSLTKELENIILIGMPGSGKSVVAQALGQRLGRTVIETDAEIVKSAGMTIPEIFAKSGEVEFRRLETAEMQASGKLSEKIISTGGGVVTREENYNLLHQNGIIIWLERDTRKLPTDGRPISQKSDLSELYKKRKPMYEKFADIRISNDGTVGETVDKIIKEIGGMTAK
ncbi:MAG: shikimate kinase [Oscillospiraceae bacterium]|nr:shikimate kinase [Oscillospiraceae bacterium]